MVTSAALSDVSLDHGLDDLIVRLGVGNEPTGAGVQVGQVEADENGNYGPDVNDPDFIGKSFTFLSGATGVSFHASNVGRRVYGTGSLGLSPDTNTIYVYSAGGWVQSNYLRIGTGNNPLSPPSNLELFNCSWIGSFEDAALDNEALRRADWSVDTHDVMMLCGIANSEPQLPLMSFGFNTVSVGLENGLHPGGEVPVGYDTFGMQIPLIVASQGTTSDATGVVSAATSLLVETRNTHPNTQSNFFAGFSETMKAVLLTGAKHKVGWTNNPISGGVNRGRTNQPIDALYGVGTVNVDRSHRVLTGGQHASSTTVAGLTAAPNAAWETAAISNNQNKYIKFNVASLADEVSVLLTWHQIANSGFGSYSLVDMNLELLTFNNGKPTPLTGDAGVGVFDSGNVISESEIDTVEHLYIRNLSPGEYVLRIYRVDGASGSRVFSVGWLFPEQNGLPGDVDGNGVIDVNDILALIVAWGPCEGCVEDLNGDGFVNVNDIIELISNW